jgi:hypothetical protein
MLTDIHPNLKLLSHSSEVLLNSCPRKYELYKMLPKANIADDSIDLTFGSLVGYGVQCVLLGYPIDTIYFKMFIYWKQDLDYNDGGEKSKKSFVYALIAIDKFLEVRVRSPLGDFELVSFDNHPAIELGYSIDLGDGFFYRGKIDAVLFSRRYSTFAILENKTTGNYEIHEAMYKNQGQGLGYSLILDVIASKLGILDTQSYDILYPVYKSRKFEWEVMTFKKNNTQRALWLKRALLAVQQITIYAEENYFPMRGESCYDFNRECKYFDICEFSNSVLFPKLNLVKVLVDKEEDYQYKFTLEELILAQLEKQST